MKTSITPKWRKLYKNGKLCYEGFTIHKYPYGSGTQFYDNGLRYREGVYGYKGLLCGKEYYPNGNVRFEGTFKPWKSYGPNPPEWGKYYSDDGNLQYEGKFKYHIGGVGYPTIYVPKDYGTIDCFNLEFRPSMYFAMPNPYCVQILLKLKELPYKVRIKLLLVFRKIRKKPALTLNEYKKLVEKYYFRGIYSTTTLNYFATSEAQEVISNDYSHNIERFNKGDIGYRCLTDGCPSTTAYVLDLLTE